VQHDGVVSASLALDIAGITIAIDAGDDLPIDAAGAARKFLCAGGRPAKRPEVRIRAAWGAPMELDRAELLFDPGKGLWRLYRTRGGCRFVFTSPLLGELPYQSASFNQDFTEGEILVRREIFGRRLPLYPLQYPLDELLMVHLLARGRGVEVHGSGIVSRDGSGTLFAGQSGAGKTTMAKLWLSEPGVDILSDERVVLREEAGEIWMYGTPWHGDGQIANQGRARLDRIFFLRHAARNELAAVSRTASIARLFACGFAPFHDAAGLDYSLAFLERVARQCACNELGFRPDRSAIAFVRDS
jgi:hypothetical protein